MELKHYLFVVAGLAFFFGFGLTLGKTLLAVFAVYLVTGGWRFAKVILLTIPRDMGGLLYLIDIESKMRRYARNSDTAVSLFQQTVKRHPDKVAMIMIDERQWTFRELDLYSNQIANYFYDQGLRKGDVVALYMESRPEYVAVWLGLAKIGVLTALINFNLRLETFAHCVNASGAKSVVFGAELIDAVREAKSHLPSDVKLYCKGEYTADGLQAQPLDVMLPQCSDLPPLKDKSAKFSDKLLYIYTSGTTGLPKAAVIINSRFFYMSYSVFYFFKLRRDDIIYDTLPLYHTAGGLLGIGNCLIQGCTIVMRKKFSATRYWDDCIRYNCTVAQYIGEICRYLLAQPARPSDKQHRVRVVFGNGLRAQIWKEFKDRFNVERIGEFYGATEGNANVINSDNTPGAIGFQTRLLPWVYPVTLIKVNQETGEPLRDHRGLCMRCEPGEPGELVGKIVKGTPLREFDGYASENDTKKKIAYNIFKKGDCYFLTGDILEMDEYGYMYFRDRTGDTYRWRGENVSTSEVEAIISNVVQLNDAVVYGVEIAGTEGRAGMAAIVQESGQIDLTKFNRDLQQRLPPYARPIFLRILDKLEMTGTFKLKKVEYKKEGFNPSVIEDRMYFLDPKTNEYKLLDQKVYEDIITGKIRL